MDHQIEKLVNLVKSTKNIVFFGGAGVSTESSIPDFRSESGLYFVKENYDVPVEMLISHTYFTRYPETFYDFYFKKMIYPHARPNDAHLALAYLEREGRLDGVITQNIDGLHHKAGSKNVVELHGSVNRNYCTACSRFYSLEEILKLKPMPRCTCSALIKPDVVLYDEVLDQSAINKAIDLIRGASLLIIGGTSLTVNPAASLVRYFQGDNLAVVNMSETSIDNRADVVIREPIGKVFRQIMN